VRISKEIQEFASGKAEGFERVGAGGKLGAPVKSGALTAEQREILEKRGVLSPEEIHRLASKTKRAMSQTAKQPDSQTGGGKASCHSDYVDPETARRMQEKKAGREVLVQVDVRPAMGIGKDDRRVV
jgi:phosphomethylpyrimidine synthase